MIFLLFILASIGMTLIIVESKLTSYPKIKVANFSNNKIIQFIIYLFNCYQCSGFWVGMVMGSVLDPLDNKSWGIVIALGFMSSFLSTLSAGFLNLLERAFRS